LGRDAEPGGGELLVVLALGGDEIVVDAPTLAALEDGGAELGVCGIVGHQAVLLRLGPAVRAHSRLWWSIRVEAPAGCRLVDVMASMRPSAAGSWPGGSRYRGGGRARLAHAAARGSPAGLDHVSSYRRGPPAPPRPRLLKWR